MMGEVFVVEVEWLENFVWRRILFASENALGRYCT